MGRGNWANTRCLIDSAPAPRNAASPQEATGSMHDVSDGQYLPLVRYLRHNQLMPFFE
jgi:hypothetical protein